MPLPAKAFGLTIASGVSLSTYVDLAYGWNFVHVSVPTMASGSGMNFFGAEAAAGTYRQLYIPPTVTSAGVAFSLASTVTNCLMRMPATPQFLKVQLPTATSDTSYTFYFICTE